MKCFKNNLLSYKCAGVILIYSVLGDLLLLDIWKKSFQTDRKAKYLLELKTLNILIFCKFLCMQLNVYHCHFES